MLDPQEFYFEHLQIPLFIIFIFAIWTSLIIRLVIFRRFHPGWFTYRGASMLLVALAGLLCTVYAILMMALNLINLTPMTIRRTEVNGEQSFERPPESFKPEEIRKMMDVGLLSTKLVLVARTLIFVALWVIKIAFLAIVLEVKRALPPLWRGITDFTSGFIMVSFLVSFWEVLHEVIASFMNGFQEYAWRKLITTDPASEHPLQFVDFPPYIEYLQVTLNIVTDVLLILVAWRTIRMATRRLRNIVVTCSVVALTLCLALARLAALVKVESMGGIFGTIGTWFQLMTEIETFLATMAACLPWVRLYVRQNDGESASRKYVKGTASHSVP